MPACGVEFPSACLWGFDVRMPSEAAGVSFLLPPAGVLRRLQVLLLQKDQPVRLGAPMDGQRRHEGGREGERVSHPALSAAHMPHAPRTHTHTHTPPDGRRADAGVWDDDAAEPVHVRRQADLSRTPPAPLPCRRVCCFGFRVLGAVGRTALGGGGDRVGLLLGANTASSAGAASYRTYAS